MKVCLLIGSPRKHGNTASLLEPFFEKLEELGTEVHSIELHLKTLKPCLACRTCQDISGGFGCPQEDDMQKIFDAVLEADTIILATPIYSWYCTPPMKSVLDRLVYGMNKYYGTKGIKECLWENKKCAIIATCGYPVERGADLFEQGIKRYCKHSKLNYMGMLAVRDEGYHAVFMNEQKAQQAVQFALEIVNRP